MFERNSKLRCPHCGAQIGISSRYCPECGQSVAQTAAGYQTGRANDGYQTGRANDGYQTGRANDGYQTGRANDGYQTGRMNSRSQAGSRNNRYDDDDSESWYESGPMDGEDWYEDEYDDYNDEPAYDDSRYDDDQYYEDDSRKGGKGKLIAIVLGAIVGVALVAGVVVYAILRPITDTGVGTSDEDNTVTVQTGTATKKEQETSSSGGQSSTTPVTETTAQPVTETTAQPVTETTAQPVTETTAQPVTETTAQPVTETTAQPVTETTAQAPVVVVNPNRETTAETSAPVAAKNSGLFKDGSPDPVNGYILPQSTSQYLSYSDISNLTTKGICYAKNEIYARYGRKFKANELTSYFSGQSWYNPKYEAGTYDSQIVSMMSAAESANKDFLNQVENEQISGGYPVQ